MHIPRYTVGKHDAVIVFLVALEFILLAHGDVSMRWSIAVCAIIVAAIIIKCMHFLIEFDVAEMQALIEHSPV